MQGLSPLSRGLPIGTLTSQCLANYYLDPLDRFLLADKATLGCVRYMDDFVFWTGTSQAAHRLVSKAAEFLPCARVDGESRRADQPKCPRHHGLRLSGLPGAFRLGRRRKRRYLESRRRYESAYQSGTLDAGQLQRATTWPWRSRLMPRLARGSARASASSGVDWRDEV